MVSLLVLLTVSPALTHHHALPPASAATCEGVWVVIDARSLGGSITTSCAPGDPGSGLAALEGAGHSYSFVPRIAGMVCTIDAGPHPCNGAPADAYWSYWHAPAGGSWSYATRGAGNRDPAPGTVEGWRFGDGSAPPGVQPPDNGPAPAADSDTSSTTTGSGNDDGSSSTGAAAEASNDGSEEATAGSDGSDSGAGSDGASQDDGAAGTSGAATGSQDGSQTAPSADRPTGGSADDTSADDTSGDDTSAENSGAEPAMPDQDEDPDGLSGEQQDPGAPQDGAEPSTDTITGADGADADDGADGADAAQGDTPRPRDEDVVGDLVAAPGDAPSEGSLPVAALVGIGLLSGIGALTYRQRRLRPGATP